MKNFTKSTWLMIAAAVVTLVGLITGWYFFIFLFIPIGFGFFGGKKD